MPLTLDEFQGEQFLGYIENVPPTREYLLEQFMPTENVYDLDFSYNVINKAYTRAASITGFDAGAPLRDKDGLVEKFGSVAKVQHGFRVSEKELLKFNRPRTDAEKQQAVEYVYDQTDNLIESVRDIKEWMRAQAIYEGVMTYSDNDVEINVDFGIPSENQLSVTTAWSDHANATPIQDLQNAVKQFKSQNNGRAPRVMHMSDAVEADLLLSEQIKAQIYGSPTDKRIVTKTDLQNVFNALSLPPYQIQDMEIDNGDGASPILPERRIAFLGESLGKTMSGVTVEKNYEPGMYVVPVIQETNPPRQEVYVGETVFPALQKPKAVVHMDV